MGTGKKRKGIMGGTFDPIHNGHLALADCAYSQFDLDEVVFLPAGNPPHKQQRQGGATDEERVAMVRLAIRDYPQFSLDLEEMKRPGLTYTKDTLTRMRRQEPDSELFFIIGADSLMAFDSWYHPEIICKSCTLTVALRDDLDREIIDRKIASLKADYGASILLMNFQEIDISSTELRERLRGHHSVRGLLPAAVADFIEENGIYEGKRI